MRDDCIGYVTCPHEAAATAKRQASELKSGSLEAAVIRVLNHSPLLDPDPDVKNRSARRREWLESINAKIVLKGEPSG